MVHRIQGAMKNTDTNTTRTVTTIPATRTRESAESPSSGEKRKVAGYARVSTDSDEQLTSYEAQKDYYTKLIKGREDWEFAGLYTDEGISATSTAHREGFKKMVSDALAGKIQLIVTKSVSRFARNTVDSLTTIRKLKEKGVEIFFEKENIYTFDPRGELLITIMSSLAQEESRSISENTTWGRRKAFSDGKYSVPYSTFLGYDRGPNGEFVINEEQAKTVRLIYRLFLTGLSYKAVALELEARKIKSPKGHDIWNPESVKSILSNEKYAGSALLQKMYTADFLTKKMVHNDGVVAQYYVENGHPAIIDEDVFALTQAEIERRKKVRGTRYSGKTVFSSRIICPHCGTYYGSKTLHSTDKYRKTIWRCIRRYKCEGGGKEKCQSRMVSEEEVKQKFQMALGTLVDEKEERLANLEAMEKEISDTSRIEVDAEFFASEMERISAEIDALIMENTQTAKDQDEYELQYNRLAESYHEMEKNVEKLEMQLTQARLSTILIRNFIKTLKEMDTPGEFDERVWGSIIESVTPMDDGSMVFNFKGGVEVTVK